MNLTKEQYHDSNQNEDGTFTFLLNDTIEDFPVSSTKRIDIPEEYHEVIKKVGNLIWLYIKGKAPELIGANGVLFKKSKVWKGLSWAYKIYCLIKKGIGYFKTLLLLSLCTMVFSCGTQKDVESPITTITAPCSLDHMDIEKINAEVDTTVIDTMSSFTFDIRFIFLDSLLYNDYYNTIIPNVGYLNDAFQGYISFRMDPYIYIHHVDDLSITPMLKDYRNNKAFMVDSICDPLETYEDPDLESYINVYVTNVNPPDKVGSQLQGFTPIFKNLFTEYERVSPEFNRIFITPEGLIDTHSLIHEVGHFFSMAHPWDYAPAVREALDLNKISETCQNYMSYNCYTDHFNEAQMVQMVWFVAKYRNYMIK